MSKKRTTKQRKVKNIFKTDPKVLAKQFGEMNYKKLQQHFQIKKVTAHMTGKITYWLCTYDVEKKGWKPMVGFPTEKRAQKEYTKIAMESLKEERETLAAMPKRKPHKCDKCESTGTLHNITDENGDSISLLCDKCYKESK